MRRDRLAALIKQPSHLDCERQKPLPRLSQHHAAGMAAE